MRSLSVDYIGGRSEVRQGGYLLRWADSTNEYHTHTHSGAGNMSEESPGSGKVRKNFEKDPRASLARTNHAVLHAPAGRRSRPEMAIDAPHYAISMLDAGCHWRVVGRRFLV